MSGQVWAAKCHKAVVDVCARELLTSHGLRSLGPGEQGYAAHYTGGPLQRDGAYHQDTTWAWLIGPFVDAHYRAYRDATRRSRSSNRSRYTCKPPAGSISEIFDADAPYTARDCFAQAWSVAELLRGWLDLHNEAAARRSDNPKGRTHGKKHP